MKSWLNIPGGRHLVLAATALALGAVGADAAGLEPADGSATDGRVPARYAEAQDAPGIHAGDSGFERRIGAELVTFDSATTDALVASGWQPPAQRLSDDFTDQGERVRTFVAIAEALGLDPAIGAEQANWGTPQENGLYPSTPSTNRLDAARYEHTVTQYDLAALNRHRQDVEAVLNELRDDPQAADDAESTAATITALVAEIADIDRQIEDTTARAETLESEIAALEDEATTTTAPATLAPSPPDGWQLVNLDVNGDAVVNQADLEAALNGMRPEAHANGSTSR